MRLLKILKPVDVWFIPLWKEKDSVAFSGMIISLSYVDIFLFFNSPENNEKDASCGKQDLFKFCDRTALNLTLNIFTWEEILKIKICDCHQWSKLK